MHMRLRPKSGRQAGFGASVGASFTTAAWRAHRTHSGLWLMLQAKGALAPLLDIGLHLLACIKELFHRLNEGLLGLLFRGLRCRRRRGGRRGGRRARCRQLFCGSAHIGDRWSCHSVHSPPCRSASLPLAYWSSGSRGYRGSNSPFYGGLVKPLQGESFGPNAEVVSSGRGWLGVRHPTIVCTRTDA